MTEMTDTSSESKRYSQDTHSVNMITTLGIYEEDFIFRLFVPKLGNKNVQKNNNIIFPLIK